MSNDSQPNDAKDTRPPFARAYPRHEELDALVDAFSRGNHRLVRDKAENLASKSDDPEVAAAARDLRKRLDPDPLAYVLLLVTAGLLITLTLWAIYRSGEQVRPSDSAGRSAPAASGRALPRPLVPSAHS